MHSVETKFFVDFLYLRLSFRYLQENNNDLLTEVRPDTVALAETEQNRLHIYGLRVMEVHSHTSLSKMTPVAYMVDGIKRPGRLRGQVETTKASFLRGRK